MGDKRATKGSFDVWRKIIEKDGYMGLYRGLGLSIGGVVVYRALYFGLFDSGRPMIFTDSKKSNAFSLWAFA